MSRIQRFVTWRWKRVPASGRAALLVACTALLAAGCAAGQGGEPTAGPGGIGVVETGTPTTGGGPASQSPPQDPPASEATTHGPQSHGLIAFRPLGTSASGTSAAEVTTQDQLDRFLASEPEVADLRSTVRARQAPGTRLFAFGLLGCQNTGARLVIDSTRVSAELTGGENIQCFAAERFVAVFAVAAGDVPAGATVG